MVRTASPSWPTARRKTATTQPNSWHTPSSLSLTWSMLTMSNINLSKPIQLDILYWGELSVVIHGRRMTEEWLEQPEPASDSSLSLHHPPHADSSVTKPAPSSFWACLKSIPFPNYFPGYCVLRALKCFICFFSAPPPKCKADQIISYVQLFEDVPLPKENSQSH